MTTLPDPADIDRRLVDLEVKASFAEDTIEALNRVVIRQQEQIDQLVREVRRLVDERRKGEDAASPGGVPADERPPHY